jgi:hypothetical protein
MACWKSCSSFMASIVQSQLGPWRTCASAHRAVGHSGVAAGFRAHACPIRAGLAASPRGGLPATLLVQLVTAARARVVSRTGRRQVLYMGRVCPPPPGMASAAGSTALPGRRHGRQGLDQAVHVLLQLAGVCGSASPGWVAGSSAGCIQGMMPPAAGRPCLCRVLCSARWLAERQHWLPFRPPSPPLA